MAEEEERLEERLATLAVLDEPLRRTLYRFVRDHGPEVSREQAALGVGISRALAAFHLDRLVEAGLLTTSFRRLTGRRGPGAGRSSKLYSRARREIEVRLPERRYELAGRLLARALDESGSSEARRLLDRAAHEQGARLGAAARAAAGGQAGDAGRLGAVLDVLEREGYEPALEQGTLVLRNCPFHALALEHRQLVCGMNLALLQGLAEEAGMPGLSARLEPAEGRCCVVMGLGPHAG